MGHYYDFFDRDFFDGLWALRWQEFIRNYRSRWAASAIDYSPGEYGGASLRELIGFCIDPKPSREVVEDILARRTVLWTALRSTPHFYFLAEFMAHVPGSRPHLAYSGEIRDAGVIIGTAATAYLAGKLPVETLRAVLKLHNAEPAGWLALTRMQKRTLAPVVASVAWLKTIYRWQGTDAFAEDSNCLGVRDTRRFANFILDAWRENWPVGPIKRWRDEPKLEWFRDYCGSRLMRDTARKAVRLVRPSMFRVWS